MNVGSKRSESCPRGPLKDSQYEWLTPSERYLLAIDARARGDIDEFRRLSHTCAVNRYWRRDPEFTERLDASFLIATTATKFLFCASIPLFAGTAAREARAEALELLTEDVLAAASDELGSWNESARIVREEARAVMVGVCKGIARFCGEIGVPPLKLLSLEESCLPLFQLYSGVDIDRCDDETAENVYEELSSMWRSYVP